MLLTTVVGILLYMAYYVKSALFREPVNKALYFDGANDYVEIANISQLSVNER